MILSSWSLGGEGCPRRHRVPWVYMLRLGGHVQPCPPGVGSVSHSRLWVCCTTCSPVGPSLSRESPLDVPCGVGGSTAGPVCVTEDGCLLPLTRGYTMHPKPPPPPSVGGSLCKPGFCELCSPPTPNSTGDSCSWWLWPFVDAYLSLRKMAEHVLPFI